MGRYSTEKSDHLLLVVSKTRPKVTYRELETEIGGMLAGEMSLMARGERPLLEEVYLQALDAIPVIQARKREAEGCETPTTASVSG